MRREPFWTNLGIGAGLMYFFDPTQGKRRRALMKDQALHQWKQSRRMVRKIESDLNNRLYGVFSEIRPKSRTKEPTPKVNAPKSAPGGQTFPSVTQASCGKNMSSPTGSFSRRLYTPTARLLTATLGGSLLIYGRLHRHELLGSLSRIFGAGLLLRGVSGQSLSRFFGMSGSRGGVQIRKTLHVHAPLDKVYQHFRSYENFPKFMSHVVLVKDKGDGRSHWTLHGPAGIPVQWEATITNEVPNQLLAWKTIDGTTIEHAGQLHFQEEPDGSTRVDVHMSYAPPMGELGHLIAEGLGADPKSQMDEDLARMKTFLETGTFPHDAAQSHKEDESSHSC